MSLRSLIRGLGTLLWYLGWAGLATGVLLLLVLREPSPGSEWDVSALVGPPLAILGALALLLGGALRYLARE